MKNLIRNIGIGLVILAVLSFSFVAPLMAQTINYGPPGSISYATTSQAIAANGSNRVQSPIVCRTMGDVEKMLRSATGSESPQAFQSFRNALEFTDCTTSSAPYQIVNPVNFVTVDTSTRAEGNREVLIFGGMARNKNDGKLYPIIWQVDLSE